MASAPITSEIEFLDLRHFSARQLRPLLEREVEVWRQRLRWDYASSTELLLEYLESRILEGLVALDRGRICGYSFCVYEGRKAVIGDAFATGHRILRDAEATQALLEQMLAMLRYSPLVDRIESQLLLFNSGTFGGLFSGPEFVIHPRLFLECNLLEPAVHAEMSAHHDVPGEMSLAPWVAQDYQGAGELVHSCYMGHQDAEINDQYRTLHGSLQFLHNIVRFPGCGVFEPERSLVLRDHRSMVGLVLISRVSPRVAHITQLCVARGYRGRGMGRVLLARAADGLFRAGFEAVTLTVTEANSAAMRLYERFGFFRRHRFDAMVMDKRFLEGRERASRLEIR